MYFIVTIYQKRGDDSMIFFDILELIVYAFEFLADIMDCSMQNKNK